MPTLHWIGKEKVVSHHQDVPYRVLEHKYGFTADKGEQPEPTNSGNKIIHGDNLEALKSLLPEYEGKIDCIYIDPPYNTGKEKWRYSDNVNHPKIAKWLDETVGMEGEDLSRHDKWLCMMYPRVKLLHKLLKDDGVFFCSIDDYEHGNLKPMLDEIFGPLNFMSNVIWQRAYSPVNTKKRFSNNHDFIVSYAKNKSLVNLLLPRTEDANDRYANPDNDPRGIWKSSDLSVAPVIEDKLYKITTPSGRDVYPPQGRCWVLTEDRYKEFLSDNRIWFGENGEAVPSVKKFLSEVKDGMTPMTVWTYEEVGHTQDAKKEIKEIFPKSKLPFETPKPTKLMEKILSLKNNPNAIILDSFAGTASTAHAVLKLNAKDGGNRKFIMVEMEDYADSITAERMKKVIKGYDFTGNKTSILKSYSVNLTSLRKADEIIDEYSKAKEDEKYSEVKIESSNGNIVILGTEKITKKVIGLDGEFDFYELDLPLFDENQNLNEQVGLAKIREYIWFSETRTSFSEPNKEPYFLGKKDESAYYFIFEKDRLTTLDFDALELIKTKGEQYVIYADNCLLPKDFMAKKNIIFKKIPRDITRF
ncbi:MAG: type III restriction endonuclease subunit M [Flavobacteriaceae bacterium CG_4_9_14_0_8_um_filter_31_91]|nr:site-specific DNA-methyltransferase [Flavobacteriia bacterium]NCT19301.1 site-specific DNA-methyltransferase [Flavobacteriia bacterium]PIV96220.1 MAG: type III restriction endonuclease subunit M [Flavobacteriaceae bacterium CG17_big_fil_post_rev_8_21_14_2_50_31_13]PJC10353.1 MAG: type III restriction endonuclease subunit M [Flavobacteriaceae bacterium CG_4_9_14_0_8_um_filter_31_91]